MEKEQAKKLLLNLIDNVALTQKDRDILIKAVEVLSGE